MSVIIDPDAGITTPALVNTGTTTVPAGSASAPTIAASGDTNTGLFFPAADTVGIVTGGLERIRADSVGRITMPYQPVFMIVGMTGYNTVNYLYGSGTVSSVNRGNHYNSTTGRFTAPITGTYLLIAGVLVEAGTGRLEAELTINGNLLVYFNGTGTVFDGPTVSAFVEMTAGDYALVKRQSGTAHSNGDHPNTYFGGYLIG